MAIVLGVLAALAIVSAIGSASKVQRRRASQPSGRAASKAVQRSIETVQQAIATPALPAAASASAQPEPTQTAQPPVQAEPQAVEPPQTELQPEPVAAAPDPVAEELVESILENMPDVPMAASLMVSEVVNPEGNDQGVQLDRPNFPIDPQETPPTHHGNNLIDEIAQLEQGDRIAQLALALEDPDSSMRVSAAYALGDLATRTQGVDRDEIIQILTRLSQDVDPNVRTQAASALGSLDPVVGE